jgi:hypothetical protein
MEDALSNDLYDRPIEEIYGLAESLAGPVQAPTPEARSPVGFNEATKQVWVNGSTFNADDHTSALGSKNFLNEDSAREVMPEGFRDVTVDEYTGYIQRIKHPSLGRLAKKSFGIGVDNLQMLGGSALRFAGAEKLGKAVVDQQIEDLSYTQPYQRHFTDIKSAGGAVEWFVVAVAQQGPMLIESSLAAIAGGVAGAIAGGGANPFTAVGGAIMALGGKAAVKQAVLAAVKKKLAKQALTAQENKLLREISAGALANVAKAGRTQAKFGGAAIGSTTANYGIGVADIYGEQIDSGDPNRGIAAALAVPYALLESLPELAALGFVAKGGRKLLSRGTKGKDRLRRTGQRLKNAAGIGLKGALFEGTTEAGQELLLLGQNKEVDANSREGMLRLINSFAAGAAVGTAIGGAGGFVQGRQVDADTTVYDGEEVAADSAGPKDLLQGELFGGENLGTRSELREGQVQGELFGDTELTARGDDRRADAPVDLLNPNQLELGLEDITPPDGQQEFSFPAPVDLSEERGFLAGQGKRAADRGKVLSGIEQEKDFFQQRAQVAQTAAFADDSLDLAFGDRLDADVSARQSQLQAEETADLETQDAQLEQSLDQQFQADEQLREREAAEPQRVLSGADINAPTVPSGVRGIGQNFSPDFTGDELITLNYTLTDTDETGSFELTVREAVEDSRERVAALKELKSCLVTP